MHFSLIRCDSKGVSTRYGCEGDFMPGCGDAIDLLPSVTDPKLWHGKVVRVVHEVTSDVLECGGKVVNVAGSNLIVYAEVCHGECDSEVSLAVLTAKR